MSAPACPHCTAAARGPHFAFQASCRGCVAREISRGPHFHRCRVAGKQDREYRELLALKGLTHEEVVAASRVEPEGAPA